jgi:phosphotransferase system  glucose/maltose/N-acetylglucosamine-specific IIC component
MEGEDLKRVMKWVGYVYVPIIIIFAAVYLFVQYRLRGIEDLQEKTQSSSLTETPSSSPVLRQ